MEAADRPKVPSEKMLYRLVQCDESTAGFPLAQRATASDAHIPASNALKAFVKRGRVLFLDIHFPRPTREEERNRLVERI